jgi:hypothetical protein
MKIIGYTFPDKSAKSREFVDEVVVIKDYSELDGDYAIDLSYGSLDIDIRPYLKGDGAYYGDYYDQYGNYSLHSQFPSVRTTYPGIVYKVSLLKECETKNPLEEIAKVDVISYIPKPIFKIIA